MSTLLTAAHVPLRSAAEDPEALLKTSAPPRAAIAGGLMAGWVAGSGAQLLQPRLWPMAVYACLCVLALVLLAFAQRTRTRRVGTRLLQHAAGVLAVGAALLGAFGTSGWRAADYAGHALASELEGRDIVLTGTIAAMPQRSDTGMRMRMAVDEATLAGVPVVVPAQVELGWWAGAADAFGTNAAAPDVRAGDRWRVTARLKAPHGTRNPHGFDYELWAWEQGIQATGSIRTGPRLTEAPRRLASGWSYPVERARQAVRDAIFARLAPGPNDNASERTARRRAAGIVAALVTGDQRAIDRADWDVFRATGVAHLVSISGVHVTMFAWLAAAVVGWLWRRSARLCLLWPAPHAALAGGVVLAAAYATFSGGGLPAQRTVLMLATVAGLRIAGIRWPWPRVWLLACALVVVLDPWALLQAGFWLSFVAVGVLFASGASAIKSIAANVGGASAGARFLSKFGTLVREQAVVTLALTPLSLLLFGQASVVGLLANLFAIPWMTLVVTPLALLGVIVAPLWDVAALAVEALAVVLRGMAGWPYASVSVPVAPAWAAAAGVFGGLLLCMRLPVAVRLLGVAPLLPVLLWQAPPTAEGTVDVLAADVGQGSAIVVRTSRHALLYDTGPRYSADSDAGHRVLAPLLRAEGVRLDAVVVSHRDSDHAGGAAAVLAQQPQARLLSSIESSHPLQALRPVERCVAGQRWRWDGVDFAFVHPQVGAYDAGGRSNALSCVLRITDAAGRSVLLAGDIEAADEAALIATGASLRADLLLVPHHGSRGASSAAWIDAVAPTVAFAQAGWRNRFGHPAPDTLARYATRGITVVASPACGAARWSSAQPAELRCERALAPHYWQHVIP